MSNLSDLLPSGGGQNIVEFTASGTVASGKPVALNSNGTVSQVTGVAEGVGTATAFTTTSVYPNYINSSYDSNAGKVVFFSTNGSGYLVATVGTVSGTSISFGTPVVANSTGSTWISSSYDSVAQKIVVGWSESGVGKAAVGTVSGTSISFGAETTFEASGVLHTNCVYDTNANRTVIAFRDSDDSNNGKAIVGTVSGTGISFGTAVTFDTVYVQFPNQVYDANAQKIAIVYQDATAGDGWSIVGTVSGTSISFGTAFRFTTNDIENHVGAYDSAAQKVVYSYRDNGNSSRGTTVVGTISGTSISFGTAVLFTSNAVTKVGTAFQVSAGKVAIVYQDSGDSDKGKVIAGTVSGTTISFGSNTTYNTGGMYGGNFITYDSGAAKNVIAYGSIATPTAYQGFGIVQQFSTSNVSDFIGLADAAISDTATGKINVKGSINSKQSSLTIGSDYYAQGDGSVSTTSTSPAVKIGQAVTATTINMMDLT